MPVLETLMTISAIAQTAGMVYSGVQANKEAEKKQAYDEKMFERLYGDQLKQRAEDLSMTKAANKFQRDLAKRNEVRSDQDRMYTRLQNAANRYSQILSNARSLRAQNASSLIARAVQ